MKFIKEKKECIKWLAKEDIEVSDLPAQFINVRLRVS